MNAAPQPGTKPARGLKRLLPHAVLLLVIVAQIVLAVVWHQPREELLEISKNGTPREKVRAIHVLTNRNVPQILTKRYTRRLLRSPDVLVRELTMTTNFSRLRPEDEQRKHITAAADAHEAIRCDILLGSRLGRGGHLTPAKMREFYEALPD